MTGDDQVRSEPFLPGHRPGVDGPTTPPPAPTRQWWEDAPDPWDQPQYQPVGAGDGDPAEEPLTEPGRSTERRFGLRRATVVIVLTGTVLIGTGALASALRPEPTALPAPPSPPARQDDPTAAPHARLGGAPSPTLSPSPTAAPSATGAGTTEPPTTPPAATEPPPPAPPPPDLRSFEAEAAELGGRARVYSTEAASGGQAVGDLGGFGLHYVRFGAVTVEPGEYELTFHYLSSRDRRGQFSINGGRLTTVDFPAAGDDAVATVTVTVELSEGEHTIWFGNTGRRAPDLDRITIVSS
ncbi:hypothetical protein JQS43_11910 [Natronosporangium hydrolyticum]|uniref:CBM6 domain-containing protein n=1 Tax=Natronosporangium hydrolyticum TaxID=2811111 RepID=A0A895YGB6_9ACTN|nr:hypothetical protein [Natronosporangium hydrolyticum]QSB16914.1 hypothetical protein JQS43_11910 [Natronosporangium hydrolyticum]